MKPVYEIVRADELRVGDTYAIGLFDEPYQFVASRVERTSGGVRVVVDETEDRIEENHAFLYGEGVGRQLPPERNPEVLERALRNTLCQLAGEIRHEGDVYATEMLSRAIGQAIFELESEAGE